jgi:hypothetical protein
VSHRATRGDWIDFWNMYLDSQSALSKHAHSLTLT